MLVGGGIHVLVHDFSPASIPAHGSGSARFPQVSEEREPDESARPSESLWWQVELILQGNDTLRRQIEPIIRGNEALRRKVEPIVQAAEWLTQLRICPLPFPLRLAKVMDAQMRVLLSPGPAAHQRSAAVNVNVAFAATAEVAAARGLALSPTVFVSAGDMATASESGSVEVPDSRRRGLAGLSDREIAFLVLAWLYALVLPWFGTALPPKLHAVLTDGYATFAIALAVTWRLLDKHK